MNNNEIFGYIYKITNSINSKCYIGQTINHPSLRWKNYKSLRCSDQPKLYNALKKYGPENFIYEIFDDTASNQEELNFLEESYMLCFNSRENGYNIKEGGSCGKHSSKTKQKMRLSNPHYWKNKKFLMETRQKMSESHKGKHKSDETRKNMSIAFKGRIYSEETRKNMSIAAKNRSETHKLNISRSLTGRKQSQETIDKRIQKIKGKKRTEEFKKLMSMRMMGENNPMFNKHHSL